MKATTYNVVRVNTRDHQTYDGALEDMAFIVNEGYFWKMSDPFYLPVGSLILAMGSYGGRGLFLNGIVTGEWQKEKKPGDYHYCIPVQWQNVAYKHPDSAVEQIAGMLSSFNYRFGERNLLPGVFAQVHAFVLSGTVLALDYHWRGSAVA